MRSFREKFRKGREAFIDEDDLPLVLIHEGAHRVIGVVVVNEEAGDHEIDFGEIELLVSTAE